MRQHARKLVQRRRRASRRPRSDALTGRAALGTPRSHRRAPMGRLDVRGNRRPGRLLNAHGLPALSHRIDPITSEARRPMHPNAHQPDDLSKLERRLSDWVPAADGLDADAMLFAAGRASARPGRSRFLWPALACATTLLAIIFGIWLRHEHTERLALAQRVEQLSTVVVPPAPPSPAVVPADASPSEEEQTSSYL